MIPQYFPITIRQRIDKDLYMPSGNIVYSHGKYDVPMSGLSCTTKLTPLASSPYSYINTRFPHVYIKNDVYPGNTITLSWNEN